MNCSMPATPPAFCGTAPQSGCYISLTTPSTLLDCWNAQGVPSYVQHCAEGQVFFCAGPANITLLESNLADGFNGRPFYSCIRAPTKITSSASTQRHLSHILFLIFTAFLIFFSGSVSARPVSQFPAISIPSSTLNLTVPPISSLLRRQLPPSACIYRQLETQVIRTDRYWSDYITVAGCVGCNLNYANCSRNFAWTQTSTWSYTVGFDIGGGGIAKEIITADIKLSFGYTWGESKSWADTTTCGIAVGDQVSVWARHQIGYADIKQRYISRAGCGSRDVVGEWFLSRAEWPLSAGIGGLKPEEYGCSGGKFADCGQGLPPRRPGPPSFK